MKEILDALRRRYSGHTPGLMDARHEYAVLCPFVEIGDQTHLLFEVRAPGLRQAGEVCFPGGRMESGESAVQCALRETWEELAIPSSAVSVLGLSDFICNQRGFLLQPVLGTVTAAGLRDMRPSPSEVAEVFTVPVSFFLETPPEVYSYSLAPQVPTDFPYEAVGISPDYPWAAGQVSIPVWYWQGHAIWGMTARIICDILSL